MPAEISNQARTASGGFLSLSKLSQLKKEAYLAGKKRDWDAAVSIYNQILEIDKNNPTLINELGDICLKMDDVSIAIGHFLAAASKYKANGLKNNAVAIYKKTLRHDPDNLNAHWYLAEIRASQGLLVEGEKHAQRFLAASESISSDLKDIFLKRCIELLALYPQNAEILDRLLGIFRVWAMPLEEARVSCLLACMLFAQDRQDEGKRSIEVTLEKCPEIVNYPEFNKWQKLTDPEAAAVHAGDVNSLDLQEQTEGAPATEYELPVAKGSDLAQVADSADLGADTPAETEEVLEIPDSSFADLEDELAQDLGVEASPAAGETNPIEEVDTSWAIDEPTAQPWEADQEQDVNLLAEILEEEPEEACEELIDLANDRGGKDNITALVVEICA